jgi:methyltransferase family protein
MEECLACGSLQASDPIWLGEAYAPGHLASLDVGAAQRTLANLAAAFETARRLHARRILDFGGGDGLLCRLLRDYGLDARVTDPHTTPTYAQGFATETLDGFDLILAFEVLEHLANPAIELAPLFRAGAPILATTELWAGQGPDWWYLTPSSGQHVFFYSARSLAAYASGFGYVLSQASGYLLFLKRYDPRFVRDLARRLRPKALRRSAARLMLSPAPGIDADMKRMLGTSTT